MKKKLSNMKQKIDRLRKRKLVKVGLVLLVLFIFYKGVFDVKPIYQSTLSRIEKNYGEYVLFYMPRCDFDYICDKIGDILLPLNLNKAFMAGGVVRQEQSVVMFQWDSHKLKKKLRDDIRNELKKLDDIKGIRYEYDAAEPSIYIFFSYNMETEIKQELEKMLEEDVYDKFVVLCEVMGKRFPWKYEKSMTHESLKENEYVYDESELKYLQDILSRSGNPSPEDLKAWNGVKWSSDTIRKVKRLNFSKYNDITGCLDLSVFTELESVNLKGMKINEVILPESFENIGKSDFDNCINLKEITFPENLKSVTLPVFMGCKNLKKLTFMGKPPVVRDRKKDAFGADMFGELSKDLMIYYGQKGKDWMEYYGKKYNLKAIE